MQNLFLLPWEFTENEICCFEHKFGFHLLSCSYFSEIVFFSDTYVNLVVLLKQKDSEMLKKMKGNVMFVIMRI